MNIMALAKINILYRRHNEPVLIRVMEDWWYFLENYSRRDQLSFVYVLWKNGFDIKSHLIKNARRPSKDFALFPHNLRLLITAAPVLSVHRRRTECWKRGIR